MQASSALMWLVLEVLAIWLATYILNITSSNLRILDIIAFSSYKFVRWVRSVRFPLPRRALVPPNRWKVSRHKFTRSRVQYDDERFMACCVCRRAMVLKAFVWGREGEMKDICKCIIWLVLLQLPKVPPRLRTAFVEPLPCFLFLESILSYFSHSVFLLYSSTLFSCLKRKIEKQAHFRQCATCHVYTCITHTPSNNVQTMKKIGPHTRQCYVSLQLRLTFDTSLTCSVLCL